MLQKLPSPITSVCYLNSPKFYQETLLDIGPGEGQSPLARLQNLLATGYEQDFYYMLFVFFDIVSFNICKVGLLT